MKTFRHSPLKMWRHRNEPQTILSLIEKKPCKDSITCTGRLGCSGNQIILLFNAMSASPFNMCDNPASYETIEGLYEDI